MSDITIRTVTPADLDAVTAVEAACFPPAEGATRESFALRIAQFPERCFVACDKDQVVGLVNGCASDLPLIEDSMFETGGHDPAGRNQMIFGLAVLPRYQRQGIGAQLMQAAIGYARQTGMAAVVLTCKEEKLHYYARFGFQNRGVSASTHGGVVWYDMVLPLNTP